MGWEELVGGLEGWIKKANLEGKYILSSKIGPTFFLVLFPLALDCREQLFNIPVDLPHLQLKEKKGQYFFRKPKIWLYLQFLN